MRITMQHLDAVKGLLVKVSSQLADQTKVTKAAEERRAKLDGQVRSLQGAFDICAGSYAQDSSLSEVQFDALPVEAQQALGYTPA
jgi:hypothetical protein